MFKKGDFVVNSNNGICEITDIVTMNVSGINKEYFQLVPTTEPTAKIYLPVEIASTRIRYAMNKEDALQLLGYIKDIDEAYIENEREREKTYKEAINSRDPKQLVGIIKTLYLRRQQREQSGKKNTAIDERYFKLAENHLHTELAFALGVDKSEVQGIIQNHITS